MKKTKTREKEKVKSNNIKVLPNISMKSFSFISFLCLTTVLFLFSGCKKNDLDGKPPQINIIFPYQGTVFPSDTIRCEIEVQDDNLRQVNTRFVRTSDSTVKFNYGFPGVDNTTYYRIRFDKKMGPISANESYRIIVEAQDQYGHTTTQEQFVTVTPGF